MQSIFWFIGVGVISIICVAIIIFKKRHSYKVTTLLTFAMVICGVTWFCEFIVLCLFDAYSYKTGVVENIWAQNILGHLLLNTTIYPSAAVIVVTCKRRKTALLICLGLFTLLDFIFIKLGVYEHHWWRSYMTTITVAVILIFAIIWFDKIKQGCNGSTRAVTFLFVALFLVHFPAPLLLILGKQHYQLRIVNNYFSDLYLSSTIIILIYHLLESFELVLITCILKKSYLKILPFAISIAVQCIFTAEKILIIDENWHIIYTLICYEVFIAAFMLIEKYALDIGNIAAKQKPKNA